MKLTIELAKKLNVGDYIEYIYPANNINKHDVIHKFIFLGLIEADENIYHRNKDVCNVPTIKARYLNEWESSFGEINETAINIPSDIGGNNFKVWRNSFRDIEIVRINENVFERE